jgi:hypothetical protein
VRRVAIAEDGTGGTAYLVHRLAYATPLVDAICCLAGLLS